MLRRMRHLPSSDAPRPHSGAAAAVGVSLALLAAVGSLDWLTGPRLDFSLFYLLPVGFVTWHTGPKLGYAMSAVSAAVWLCVDRLTGAQPSYPLVVPWNLAMRLAFFAGSVLLLEGWKRSGRHLADLVEQRTAALRRMAAQLSAAEEAERRRLATDLHDAFSQTLSLVRMNLDAAHLESPADRPSVQRRLAECGAMVDGLQRQARTLMFDLYPAMLDDLGLVPTLHWYAGELRERAGAEVVVSERGGPRALPAPLANYLFRAAKELLGNAVRHGRAGEISLMVHWEPTRLRLVVDDDGTGFAADAPDRPAAGLGLTAIRERLGSMGGRLHIESNPGQGARVIVDLPLRPDAADQPGDDHVRTRVAG